jgi:DNA-binding beta-propeller fold protein YncE
VADEDEASVTAIDAEAREELATTPVGGAPSQLLLGRDGVLYAALRDQGAVVGLEWTGRKDGSLKQRSRFVTADEPVALALTPDGRSLLVASAWGRRLEGFCISGLNGLSSDVDSNTVRSSPACSKRSERLFSAALPREPRSVLLSSDGRTAFVSHMVGSVMSAIDLSDPERRARSIPMNGGDIAPPPHTVVCAPSSETDTSRIAARETKRLAVQGFSLASLDGRIFAPQALARTGDPSLRTDGYGLRLEDLPSQIANVAVLEEGASTPLYSSVHPQVDSARAHTRRFRDCLLPRAAAADPSRKSLFVACVDIHAVLELDPSAPDPAHAVKRRYPVATGPTGIAIDSQRGEAYVWSQFARTLSVLSLGEPRPKKEWNRRASKAIEVRLSQGDDLDGALAMGRILFHTSNDRRIAEDGRACASCHPDGRDDGLIWPTPEGPRQPPMLAGRLEGTAPYSWGGEHKTIEEHIKRTLKRLRGRGLEERHVGALAAYINSIEGPRRRAVPEPDPLVARGRAIFSSMDAGCTNCHREDTALTDGSLHDVSSSARADQTSVFETPSLRFVGGTAPYFHDGRFANLRDLLYATRKTMGSTTHLGEEDMAALEAYLTSL